MSRDAIGDLDGRSALIPNCRARMFRWKGLLAVSSLRTFLAPILVMLNCVTVSAQTTYYVSLSGNDSNTGTSPSTPWGTLAKIASVSYLPGDSILIKRGDTFEGQIAIVLHGSPSAPVVIGAYGTGAKPIIYGDLRGRTWTKISGRTGYYKAFVGLHSEVLTGFWQWRQGAWVRSLDSGYQGYRGTDTPTWGGWLDQIPEGGIGTDFEHDTLFVHTYGSVALPTARDSFRVYRYANHIEAGSHDYFIRDLDGRNFYTPFVCKGENGIARNLSTTNGYSSGMRFIQATHGLIDSCVVDSSGDTGIYLVSTDRTVVRHNLVTNVLLTLDGGISAGIDLCGIGILDNYATGRAQDTIGYNTVEYNTFNNIYRAFTDFFFCVGDTVRFNIGHNALAAGSPHGTNIVMTYNNFVFSSGDGGNGPNIGQLANGNITFSHNTLDSVKDYGVWVSDNQGSGTVTIQHNTIRMLIPARSFVDYKTTRRVTATDNWFIGNGDKFSSNGVDYSDLASFQAATGYEARSIWSSSANAPTGALSATPDSLPTRGGTVRLQWSFTNAVSAFLKYKIRGADTVISVDTSGSRTLDISGTTVFRLELTGPFNDKTLLTATVTVGGSATVGGVLEQNYPNPFNGGTTITFTLSEDRDVSLKVFDLLGREIVTLAHGIQSRGSHQVRWSASGMASGVYFCRLISGLLLETRAMTLLH